MSENLSRLDRLRIVGEWQAYQLGRTDRTIAELEKEEAAAARAERIQPQSSPTWKLSVLRASGGAQADAVHTDDCGMGGKRTQAMTREQALHALTTRRHLGLPVLPARPRAGSALSRRQPHLISSRRVTQPASLAKRRTDAVAVPFSPTALRISPALTGSPLETPGGEAIQPARRTPRSHRPSLPPPPITTAGNPRPLTPAALPSSTLRSAAT